MPSSETAHVLDNPAWHALNTHHAHLASGTTLAKRYPRDVALAVAVIEHSEAAHHDLAQIVPAGETVGFFEAQPPSELPGWTIQFRGQVVQMICERPVPEPENPVPIVTLKDADVPDMLNLIEQTHPGPFLPRTIETGRYLGIRQQGQLIAMAGERLYPPGYREISAVCTHPDHVGKGYARQLVSRLVNDNFQQGNIPFLHVNPDNARAYRLYEMLNFRRRCELHILVFNR